LKNEELVSLSPFWVKRNFNGRFQAVVEREANDNDFPVHFALVVQSYHQ